MLWTQLVGHIQFYIAVSKIRIWFQHYLELKQNLEVVPASNNGGWEEQSPLAGSLPAACPASLVPLTGNPTFRSPPANAPIFWVDILWDLLTTVDLLAPKEKLKKKLKKKLKTKKKKAKKTTKTTTKKKTKKKKKKMKTKMKKTTMKKKKKKKMRMRMMKKMRIRMTKKMTKTMKTKMTTKKKKPWV